MAFASEEDKAIFDEPQRELFEDLKPVGRLQELMVEEIATCAWKLQVAQQLIERELGNREEGAALAPTIEKFVASRSL